MKHPCSLYLEHDLVLLLEARAIQEGRSKSYLANEILKKALLPGTSDDPVVAAAAALHPAQLIKEAAERQGFMVQPASELVVAEPPPPAAIRLSPQEAKLAQMRSFLQISKETCKHPTEFQEHRGQVLYCKVCGEEVE